MSPLRGPVFSSSLSSSPSSSSSSSSSNASTKSNHHRHPTSTRKPQRPASSKRPLRQVSRSRSGLSSRKRLKSTTSIVSTKRLSPSGRSSRSGDFSRKSSFPAAFSHHGDPKIRSRRRSSSKRRPSSAAGSHSKASYSNALPAAAFTSSSLPKGLGGESLKIELHYGGPNDKTPPKRCINLATTKKDPAEVDGKNGEICNGSGEGKKKSQERHRSKTRESTQKKEERHGERSLKREDRKTDVSKNHGERLNGPCCNSSDLKKVGHNVETKTLSKYEVCAEKTSSKHETSNDSKLRTPESAGHSLNTSHITISDSSTNSSKSVECLDDVNNSESKTDDSRRRNKGGVCLVDLVRSQSKGEKDEGRRGGERRSGSERKSVRVDLQASFSSCTAENTNRKTSESHENTKERHEIGAADQLSRKSVDKVLLSQDFSDELTTKPAPNEKYAEESVRSEVGGKCSPYKLQDDMGNRSARTDDQSGHSTSSSSSKQSTSSKQTSDSIQQIRIESPKEKSTGLLAGQRRSRSPSPARSTHGLRLSKSPRLDNSSHDRSRKLSSQVQSAEHDVCNGNFSGNSSSGSGLATSRSLPLEKRARNGAAGLSSRTSSSPRKIARGADLWRKSRSPQPPNSDRTSRNDGISRNAITSRPSVNQNRSNRQNTPSSSQSSSRSVNAVVVLNGKHNGSSSRLNKPSENLSVPENGISSVRPPDSLRPSRSISPHNRASTSNASSPRGKSPSGARTSPRGKSPAGSRVKSPSRSHGKASSPPPIDHFPKHIPTKSPPTGGRSPPRSSRMKSPSRGPSRSSRRGTSSRNSSPEHSRSGRKRSNSRSSSRHPAEKNNSFRNVNNSSRNELGHSRLGNESRSGFPSSRPMEKDFARTTLGSSFPTISRGTRSYRKRGSSSSSSGTGDSGELLNSSLESLLHNNAAGYCSTSSTSGGSSSSSSVTGSCSESEEEMNDRGGYARQRPRRGRKRSCSSIERSSPDSSEDSYENDTEWRTGIREYRTLYVGGVLPSTTGQELKLRFQRFGQITGVHVVRKFYEHHAYVTFKSTNSIRNAIERGNDPYYVDEDFLPPVVGPYYMLDYAVPEYEQDVLRRVSHQVKYAESFESTLASTMELLSRRKKQRLLTGTTC
uniref:RRM domain-containing protein n=1 Tax=Cacopsylla melanoneura TaxID=428564 RepID=A0A8D8RVL8_9HEMI